MQRVAQGLSSTKFSQYLAARSQLWRDLHLIHPHPVSRHIQRQLGKQRDFPILAVTILWGGLLLLAMLITFSRVGAIVFVTLPLWLMGFSAAYVLPWLYRIAAIIKRQYRDSVVDEIGVIPPGGMYVTFAVCHAVMNEHDRLSWIRLLRLFVVLIALIGTGFATLLAVTQIQTLSISGILPILVDMAMLTALLYLEHQQSILIACYLAVYLPQQTSHPGNLITNAYITYIAIQSFTWMMPIALLIALQAIGGQLAVIAIVIALFMLFREGILLYLWSVTQHALD